MIAYYAFSSHEGAIRELQRLAPDHHFVSDNVLKNESRFFSGSDGAGATFAVNCKSDLIVVNADKLKADDVARRRLKRVAQLVLDPKLRGHIPE